tara:strand:- start:3212 stop:3385 length:174 start_codon:yes stop_codon:yes gene_type:complete
MSDPNKLVGRLVKIAGKIGIIASCEYVDENDMWALSIVLNDGERFISFPSLIHRFLI